MSTQERLSTTELASFWRVAKTSLSSWRSQSRITMGEQDSPHPKSTFYYPFSDLDAYHLEHLHPRYSSFPATAELWALQLSTGQPTLLTVPEVAAKARMSVPTVNNHIRLGHLPAMKLWAKWRIPAPALGPLMARYDTRGTVNFKHAQDITGLSLGTLRLLGRGDNPAIKRAEEVAAQEVRLDKESFLAFLARHLVNCSVNHWYALRLLYDYEPLITIDAACRRFHVHSRRFLHLMEVREGNWPYMRTPGGHASIPLHVVERWAKTSRRWPPRIKE